MVSVINLPKWCAENRDELQPPVCNKMIHKTGQLKVFAVGGPNQRRDYHIEEGEELFYQIRGGMVLKVIENGCPRDIPINEGELFLLPGNIFHSPQRFENTLGLVIERERASEEKDGLVYFVHDEVKNQPTPQKLYEKYFYCEDLGTQLAPIIKAFFASEQFRTGQPIQEELEPNPPVLPDANARCGKPRPLQELLTQYLKGSEAEGADILPGEGSQSSVKCLGEGCSQVGKEKGEVWIWVISGTASAIDEKGEVILLNENDTLLVKQGQHFELVRPSGAALLAYSQTKPKVTTC